MNMRSWAVIAFTSLLPFSALQAADISGRFSMLAMTAHADAGDVGNSGALSADQQSLRLMLDSNDTDDAWSLHVKSRRQHISGEMSYDYHASDLFRYRPLDKTIVDQCRGSDCTQVGSEIDRGFYKHQVGKVSLSVGRQAIDWGSGRFWQPLNVFGAFSPTDLDTDYKAGIDAVLLDWFPTAFSSLTMAYVFSAEDGPLDDSAVMHYRRQVGSQSEMALMAGSVVGNKVMGGFFESAWGGMGWRVEGTYYQLTQSDENLLFTVAGVDYQLSDGTMLIAEWYRNSRGALDESSMSIMSHDPRVLAGLQPHLGRDVFGLGINRDLSPLWQGSYTLLLSSPESALTSSLHQMSARYSVSDESDLLLAVTYAQGKGMDAAGEVRSEFGHVPLTATARLQFYF